METEKQFDLRIKSAEREHDFVIKAMEMHATQTMSYANAAMRAPALVAAAGIAAALGFYSANYSRLSHDAGKLVTFNEILFWLFLALLLTVAAPGLAYFSQMAYSSVLSSKVFTYDHPYVTNSKHTRKIQLVGDFFRWSAVGLIAVSIMSLIRGGYLFLGLL